MLVSPSTQHPYLRKTQAQIPATAPTPKTVPEPQDSVAEISSAARDTANRVSSKPSLWRKASMIALLGMVGLGSLATPAQAADLSISIGRNGVRVEVGAGHHHHGPPNPGHRHPGGPGHGNGCHDHHHHDGSYHAYGIDGQYHRFDRYGHVNDHTGHYQLRHNQWGGVIRIYQVGCHN